MKSKIITKKEAKRILTEELKDHGFNSDLRKDTMAKTVYIDFEKNKIGIMIRYTSATDGWYYFQRDRNEDGLKDIIKAAKGE